MIKNYINVSIRNLTKHKFYSLINILGLSIGLTCFILISLFVVDELSYDKFHSDSERIYRMDFSGKINGNEFITALAGAPTGPVMATDFPEVASSFRFRGTGSRLLKRKDVNINFKNEDIIWADKNFIEFWGVNLLQGDAKTCLERPKTLILSKSKAETIFGEENPMGKTLIMDDSDEFEVTGIYEDLPANSHFSYGVLLTMESREEAKSTVWMSFNFNTYLKLTPTANPDSLAAKFPTLLEEKIGPEIEQFLGQSMEDFLNAGNYGGFDLFPVKDIHLKSDKLGDLEQNGSMQYVYIFAAIALFILILACINFMNLSTARSASRAKEVGVRKVLGAYRQHLVFQFLSEAFIITLISILIATAASTLILPFFNQLADKSIVITNLFTPLFFSIMLAILVIVGLLAGSYPAFYLSKFKPVEVLKGKLNLGMKSGGIRSTLVVIQFSISIIMMVGTAIVFNQLNFVQNKKLGFDKDQILMIEDAWLLKNNLDAFKTEALRDPHVINGTVASFLPVGTTNNNNMWFKGRNAGQGDNYIMHNYRIDHNYIETLGMEITDGRNFSEDFISDSTAVLINEAAAKQIGYKNTVGEFIASYGGSQQEPTSVAYKIVGIVKDFHFSTMRENITPLIFTLDERKGFISFKIQSDDISNTVKSINKQWDALAPGQPFQYSFLDDRFNEMYESEQKIGNIFSVFAFLAIFIACLGLYGLAAFTAEQKNKEIGIRKVLGASIAQIISLLSKEFVRLLIISFVIGSVTSYFVMREWLNEFVYRVDINDPTSFILAGLATLVISWVTMSSQSLKAARANPVNSLKDE